MTLALRRLARTTKVRWDELDYAELTEDSLEAIDWTKVNFKKAALSPSFDLEKVDVIETSSSSKAFNPHVMVQV